MTREGVRAAWGSAAELLRTRLSRAELEVIGRGPACLGARLAVRMLDGAKDREWALSIAASHAAGFPGGAEHEEAASWPG